MSESENAWNASDEDGAAPEVAPDPPTLIVGIGASAGGLEALERFFHVVPVDTGMVFVVIQHLSPDFKSLMDELLARFTRMPIVRVDDTVVPRRDSIYLLPPRKEMVMRDGRLYVLDKALDQPLSMPINTFFRSLAREAGDRGVAIVLSGTGSDGSLGLVEVHEAGGLVLAQSTETAKFDGMPRSAAATGKVDSVLAPEDMPRALVAYAKNMTDPAPADPSQLSAQPRTDVPAVIDKLRDVYGIDFNYYKPATITRRIERRVMLGNSNVQEYCAQVLREPAELDALYKDLLIGVTRFFRDPEAFALIEAQVVPAILDQVPPGEDIRVWVPGCATGEEPYSLAILLLEALAERGREANLKIFASDVHRDSLQIAAEGYYSATSIADLSEQRRERFFEREGEGLRVTAHLRRHILFSHHNIIRDPAFTRMDLVSCRNTLIYFQPAAQVKALASFYFALKVGGHLFLGPSESVNELQTEFDVVDRQAKIFRKLRDTRLPQDMRMDLLPVSSRQVMRASTPGELRTARVYDAILKRYMPTAVLTDARREVIHVFGDAERYLRVPAGRMSADLVAMTRGDLRVAVSSALQNALKKNERVSFRGVRFTDGERDVSLDVVADPITDASSSNTYVLVLFDEQGPRVDASAAGGPASELSLAEEARARIQQLEVELLHTRDSLNATVEEIETSNEELQSTNEELLAANEELQSTNEELHSVNEELYSVNSEHEQRINDLNRVSSDLKNLIQATEIGTVFLDRDHRIRFFTPAAARLFNLMVQDVGRDIRHITTRVKDDDVFEDIRAVTTSLIAIEKRVQTSEGESYLRRVMPYFDAAKVPSGLVLTFVDITALSRAEALTQRLNTELAQRVEELDVLNRETTAQRDVLDQRERFIRSVTDNLPGMVGYWDRDLRCRFANPAYHEWFGVDARELLGQSIQELLGPEMFAENESYIRGALSGVRQRFEREIRKPSGELSHVLADYIPYIVGGEASGFVVLINDITERRRTEQEVRQLNEELERRLVELRASEERFRRIFEGAPEGILGVDSAGKIRFVNAQIERMFGYDTGELEGQDIEVLVPDELRAVHSGHRRGFIARPEPRPMGKTGWIMGRRRDGSVFPIQVGLSPLVSQDDVQVMAFITDTTRTRKLEAERDEILRKMTDAQKLESLSVLAGGIAHDFNNLLTGIMANVSMLADAGEIDDGGRDSIELILESSRRAADLCKQLLAYSGRGQFVLRTQDVSKLVEATTKLVRASSVSKRIDIRFELAPNLPPVVMDATQIRQVIMNLVINACEAVELRSGQITIRTGVSPVTAALLQSAVFADSLTSDECVFIEVSDNGSGIKEEDLVRIFEPFYTTKFTGRGLGLSAVLGIVRGHHGALTVRSEVGRGTTFRVLLPPASPAELAITPDTAAEGRTWRGSGTVLVADDETPIRSIVRRMLIRMGYEVVEASDGLEALELFARDPGRFTLVLLDLTMPGMAGAAVFVEMRRLRPDVRVLVMSGFSQDDARATLTGHVPTGFLAKPFDLAGLVAALREVMTN